MPRVTVIIATYNWSSVLPYSIGSVIRQRFTDWELLVVGDACTDDSAAVVAQVKREHGLDDERIRWFNLPTNAGSQYAPNNAGIREARGELIAYLGHDDLWLPHHLEVLVAALDAGADVPYSAVRWIAPEGGIAPFPPDACISPVSVLHRRADVLAIGGWRDYRTITAPSDGDLWERLRAAGLHFRFVPRLTVIKLPATTRRNVYKLRPSHEQAAWAARIAQEPDLETSELLVMLGEADRANRKPPTNIVVELRRLVFHELPKRILYKVERLLRYRRAPSGPAGKGEQVSDWRRFKGLE